MERNRVAQLIQTAAARGIIDFSQARLDDPNWIRRLKFTLAGLARELEREALTYMQAHTAAMLPVITPESRQKAADRLAEMSRLYQVYTFPWRDVPDEEADARNMMSQVERRWSEEYGDMDSPEVQERIARTVAALEQVRSETAAQAKQLAESSLLDLQQMKAR